MLSKEPVRIRHDWNAGVMADCDQCGRTWQMTVPSSDGGRMCAGCCDETHLANWQSYARDLATELRSLREQLAELKALGPVAEVVSKFGDPEAFGERELNILADIQKMPYGTQLFTAAKPADLKLYGYGVVWHGSDLPAHEVFETEEQALLHYPKGRWDVVPLFALGNGK